MHAMIIVAVCTVNACAAVGKALEGDPVAGVQSVYAISYGMDDTGGFVAGGKRLRMFPMPVVRVKITSADAAAHGLERNESRHRVRPTRFVDFDFPDTGKQGDFDFSHDIHYLPASMADHVILSTEPKKGKSRYGSLLQDDPAQIRT